MKIILLHDISYSGDQATEIKEFQNVEQLEKYIHDNVKTEGFRLIKAFEVVKEFKFSIDISAKPV